MDKDLSPKEVTFFTNVINNNPNFNQLPQPSVISTEIKMSELEAKLQNHPSEEKRSNAKP